MLGIVPLQQSVCTGYDGQQLSLLQHFLHVNLLHVGVVYSPSVVPSLAGYAQEHPVEQVPGPILIHFVMSACHCHVHVPVHGCSVVVVVVVADVVVLVVVDELLDEEVVVVELLDELVVVDVVELLVVVVVVGVLWQPTMTSCP